MEPRIVIFGEPRDLAESLAEKLSKFYQIPIFDTSNFIDIRNIKEHKITLGREIKLKLALINESYEGFIINNLPLKDKDFNCVCDIDLGIFVNPNEETTIAFNGNRRWCPTCFRTYHLDLKQPLHEGRCDRCDSDIEALAEDDPKEISDKFFEWKKSIHPLVEKFRNDKKLLEVNMDSDLDEISTVVSRILKGIRKQPINQEEFEPTFKI